MRRHVMSLIALSLFGSAARAQVDLTSYSDAERFINVHALCYAQLASNWQEDADKLVTRYSGLYNRLAKKRYVDIRKAKEAEYGVIICCSAHP